MAGDAVAVSAPALEIQFSHVDLGAELRRSAMERAGVREQLTLCWILAGFGVFFFFFHTGQSSISGTEGTADHIPGEQRPEVPCHCHRGQGLFLQFLLIHVARK